MLIDVIMALPLERLFGLCKPKTMPPTADEWFLLDYEMEAATTAMLRQNGGRIDRDALDEMFSDRIAKLTEMDELYAKACELDGRLTVAENQLRDLENAGAIDSDRKAELTREIDRISSELDQLLTSPSLPPDCSRELNIIEELLGA